MEINFYNTLLADIKARIRDAQIKAALSVNAEMILMYNDIGKMIHTRQQEKGWSARIIPNLCNDLRNELPEIKGFSERNLSRMLSFYREYADSSNLPQAVANLNYHALLVAIPWGHNIILIEKVKDLNVRFWYIQATIENGWSRDVLTAMIKSDLFARQGATVHNFKQTLLNPQSDLVQQTLKDPYIFDFLTLSETFQERELETELVKHIEKFVSV